MQMDFTAPWFTAEFVLVKAKSRSTASVTWNQTLNRKERICIDPLSSAYLNYFKIFEGFYATEHPHWLVKKSRWQDRVKALVSGLQV
jgi:hypothetical protein